MRLFYTPKHRAHREVDSPSQSDINLPVWPDGYVNGRHRGEPRGFTQMAPA